MHILQVNTFDQGGGAESVAARLHVAYQREGHGAWLAVKQNRTGAPGVRAVPETLGHSPWGRFFLALAGALDPLAGRMAGGSAMAAAMRAAARPLTTLKKRQGREDFHFPSSARIPELIPHVPDVLHCHNLHGNYFDLSALAPLSQRFPVVLTLHDCWLLSGHCAHPFDCDHWRTGCGQCPDLTIYPAVAKDSTAANWRRKRDIFAASRLFVAAPSRWLLERAKQSILMAGVNDARVIENGIDDRFFAGGDRAAARRLLGLSESALMVLFAANTIRDNLWKDYATLRAAIEQIAARFEGREVVLIALGDEGKDEKLGSALLRFVAYQRDPAVVANYYRAADLYLHTAKAETFSLTIAEAMACGTPVVATAVGAVPERIKCLAHPAAYGDVAHFGSDEATGVLVPPADPGAIAEAAVTVLTKEDLSRKLGGSASTDARRRYSMAGQAHAYLEWFEEIRTKMESPSS